MNLGIHRSLVPSSLGGGRYSAAVFGVLLLLQQEAQGEPSAPTAPSVASDIEVSVHGQRAGALPTTDTSTGNTFSRETQEEMAGGTRTNPYRVLQLLPSVHVASTDATGVVLDQNAIRVRGQLGQTFARLSSTIERVPLSYNEAQGSMGNLFDLENVYVTGFHRGPIPVDRGFGLGNSAGALDLRILQPAEHLGFRLRSGSGATFGQNAAPFESMFVRADTGKTFLGLRAFASVSDTRAMKWRGSGDIHRSNGTLGIMRTWGKAVSFETYGVVNRFTQYEYRPLTYAQTLDPASYESFDYTTDRSYLDYRNNRQTLTEFAWLAKLQLRPSRHDTLLIEPYAGGVTGDRYSGSAPNPKVNGVYIMDITQKQVGLLAEYRRSLWEGTTAAVGLWANHLDSVPPQKSQKFYTLDNSGNRVFSRFNMLTQVGQRRIYSPYVALQAVTERWQVDAGLKAISIGMPEVVGYDGSALPDMGTDAALASSPPRVPGASADARTVFAWLPYLGVRRTLSDGVSARAAYGRNYAHPFQGPLYSTYRGNAESFGNQGITLNQLWNGLKLETSDNVDLGLELTGERVQVRPTVFYAWFHDKQVMAFDPTVGVGYFQNVAAARGMGAELEIRAEMADWISAYFAGSYNRVEFTTDLQTKSATTLPTNGKVFADAPTWLAKAGTFIEYKQWRLAPLLQYVSARYGDLLNTEHIDGYVLLDAALSYHARHLRGLQDLGVTLRGTNLLNRRYISIIKNQQDVSEALSTTYYPGAPLTVMLTVDAQLRDLP